VEVCDGRGGDLVAGRGGGSRVRALEEKSGKAIWRTGIGERIRSTPAIADGMVFAGTVQGRLHALALKDGALRWKFDTEGTNLDSAKFGYDRRSIQSSPAAANGVVYFGARDGWVYAVGARDGKERWRYDHHISWIITSPAVADGVIYEASSDGAFVQALNAADGTERWRTKTGARRRLAGDGTNRLLARRGGQPHSWVKNYGGPPGTGLVRVPGDDPVKLYFAAEYRPAMKP
jgi:outer membrane protein assembly factor BamB